jgi:hypothetical protein
LFFSSFIPHPSSFQRRWQLLPAKKSGLVCKNCLGLKSGEGGKKKIFVETPQYGMPDGVFVQHVNYKDFTKIKSTYSQQDHCFQMYLNINMLRRFSLEDTAGRFKCKRAGKTSSKKEF